MILDRFPGPTQNDSTLRDISIPGSYLRYSHRLPIVGNDLHDRSVALPVVRTLVSPVAIRRTVAAERKAQTLLGGPFDFSHGFELIEIHTVIAHVEDNVGKKSAGSVDALDCRELE
jgi:hypothetical protein